MILGPDSYRKLPEIIKFRNSNINHIVDTKLSGLTIKKIDYKSGLRLVENADIVIVRFGEKYKQWNAAFDAGYAAALGIPIITIHDASNQHALKEIDAASLAVVSSPSQIVPILKYVIDGKL